MTGEDDKPRALINISVTDIFGLSKAGETLAKAIERGTGRAATALAKGAARLTYPFLLKRDTEAEVAAASAYVDMLKGKGLIATDAEIELRGRAIARITTETIRQQANREAVARLAIADHVEDTRAGHARESAGETSIDWVDAFWRHAENVSDEGMQRAWAHVLAREARKPGTFSLRALSLLSTLSHREAEAIVAIARIAYEIRSRASSGFDHGVITAFRHTAGPQWTPEIEHAFDARLRKQVPVVADMLEPIGIFRESGYAHTALAMPDNDEVAVRIADRVLLIRGLPEVDGLKGHLGSGHGITDVGWELMQIARPTADAAYVETLKVAYEKQGCNVIVR